MLRCRTFDRLLSGDQMHGVGTVGRPSEAMRRTRETTVAALVIALVASFLAVVSSPSRAGADATYPVAGLLSVSALNAPELNNGAYYPGGVYSATLAQRGSLQNLEDQAVADTIADHHLASTDQDAVLTWGRSDADAELWALLNKAATDVHSGSATTDEQNAVAWMAAMLKRQGILVAQNAALEYTKWAGLGTAQFQALLQTNPSEASLQTFLSGQINTYTDGANGSDPAASVDGGYCVYQSPAPYQSQYTSNVYSSGVNSNCSAPCTNVLGCPPPTPTYASFAAWGAADATNSLYSKFQSPEQLKGIALGGTLDAIASNSTVTQTLSAFSLAGVFASTGFAGGLAQLATQLGTIDAAAGLDAAAAAGIGEEASVETLISVSETIGAELSATGIGVIVGAVIFAVATAIQEGLTIFSAAALPGQLASLYAGAVTATPDPYAVLQDSGNAAGLFALFAGATLPAPTLNSCDNTNVAFGTTVTAACLNGIAAAGQTGFDPQWIVTPQGGTASAPQETLTTTDGNGLTVSSSLHGNWFIDTTTLDGTTAAIQSLRMHYTDWDGNGHTAWIYTNQSPPQFLTVADSAITPSFDPATCVASGQCGLTPTIDVVAPDGTKETVAVVGGGQPPAIPAPPVCAASSSSCVPFVGSRTIVINAPSNVAVGQSFSYTAYVDSDNGTPSGGTVEFDEASGPAPGCSAQPVQDPLDSDHVPVTTLSEGVVARCTITFSTPGPQYVFATYSGTDTAGSSFLPSQGGIAVNVVPPIATDTSVTVSPGQPAVGQLITLTATVTPQSPLLAPPTGIVEFNDDSSVLCAAAPVTTTAPYTATCTTTYASVVSEHIVATYSGDGESLTSYGITQLTTTNTGTTTTGTPSAGPYLQGHSITDTVTITGVAGTPVGNVSFSVCGPLESAAGCATGGSPLGSPVAVDGSGSATSAAFTLNPAGVYCFRADYSGAVGFTASSDGSSAQCVTVTPDTTKPTISVMASPMPNVNGWNNTSVTVSFYCTDAGSGVDAADSALANQVLTASGTATGTCVDNAGNTASTSYTAKIDTTAPTITAVPTPAANVNGWNNTSVTVAFTCTDAGSGVDAAQSALLNQFLTASGKVTGACTDNAGNSATAPYTAQIDRVAPTITAMATPAANANGWNNTSVTVSFACTDAGSGVDAAHSSLANQVLAASGKATGSCVDDAGNSVSTSYTAQIDKVAPTVTYAGNNGSYGILDPVAITCTAADAQSGIASSTCAGATGLGWTFGAGAHLLSAQALDKAGNAGSSSTSFTVTVKSADLAKLTTQFVTGSAKYQSSNVLTKVVIALLATIPANVVLGLAPTAKPAVKAQLLSLYKADMAGLVSSGYLTSSQQTTLLALAATI
jgi:hypothetical protein